MKKNIILLLLATIINVYMLNAANPFFKPFNTPHQTAPFDKIRKEHYEPAFEKAMKEHLAEIDRIVRNREPATFENTIVAYERSGQELSRLAAIFYNINSAETSDNIMEISRRISPKMAEHDSNISLNEALFARIKTVYDRRDSLHLDAESRMLLDKTYLSFTDRGAKLNDKDKETYRRLTADLSKLTLDFGQNVLKETNRFELLLTQASDLAGLPENLREAAAQNAKQKGKQGWLFDLKAPSYIPFMKYSERRELREKMYRAYSGRCAQGGEFDNRETVRKIVDTRLQIARLLDDKDYAEYVLRQRMAQNTANVYDLLNRLRDAYRPLAMEEIREVSGFASGWEKQSLEIMPWDWAYYSEKLKDIKFRVNDEMTRPYFELEKVKQGVFGLATELFGISFRKNTRIPVYHSEVEAFEVFDENKRFLAVLYTDFFPREGKRQGAWMTEYKGQWKDRATDSRPHISLVMNFTRPTATRPALLTFDEVKTFLHEFGHSLHGMFADGNYESLSGTNVYRDFVELPSQLMENFLLEKAFLDRFAVHYQTGEKIPALLVQKLIDAGNFNAGYACLRQLNFGYLDMAWHTLQTPCTGDILEFERTATQTTRLLTLIPEACISTSFNHIFAGGYAAGYYGYKWAEVLDADAYSLFKANGIFNRSIARKYRETILSKGGSEDPMTLYIRFKGNKPTIDALLERNGIER
ncbi:MAG: M3 family metallopeptidase [Dysgonamonadaceae bacterium]|nr:M3 family metallopeptidase [Dysgonamonadaceae bacterium]